MNDSLEDVLFVLDMINVLAIDDLGFFHGLNSILVLVLSLHPADFHVAKGAFSQRLAKADIFGLQFVENAFVFLHGC